MRGRNANHSFGETGFETPLDAVQAFELWRVGIPAFFVVVCDVPRLREWFAERRDTGWQRR
jgi:hypothetical protein